MQHNSLHLLREHLRGSLLWLRQLLIDTDSYSNDWPPPFNIKPGRHFALRGDNDEEVIEKLKKQQRKYWVFKFVDLVFVALLSKLSKVLENCALSFHSFVFVTSLFCLLFVTRMMADEYGVQFIAHDSFHIICYYVYFMSNFIMVLNINVVENHEHLDSVCSADFVSFGFFVGFVCSRLVILTLFSRVVVEDELWKESSQKTLGHELHDTVLANCQHQAQWTEVDGEGRYVPCAQCAAHEFANCDADDGCARCARHEECFWACKDSCNAILAQYPNQRFTPEDIAFSVGMLRTLKVPTARTLPLHSNHWQIIPLTFSPLWSLFPPFPIRTPSYPAVCIWPDLALPSSIPRFSPSTSKSAATWRGSSISTLKPTA